MGNRSIWATSNAWELITSLSTLAAVLLALYLSVFQRKRKIEIIVSNNIESNEIILHIINIGYLPIVINNACFIEEECKECNFKTYDKNKSLPKFLQIGESIDLFSPYVSHNFKTVHDIYVEDTTGKKWHIRKKSLRFIKKHFKNTTC